MVFSRNIHFNAKILIFFPSPTIFSPKITEPFACHLANPPPLPSPSPIPEIMESTKEVQGGRRRGEGGSRLSNHSASLIASPDEWRLRVGGLGEGCETGLNSALKRNELGPGCDLCGLCGALQDLKRK